MSTSSRQLSVRVLGSNDSQEEIKGMEQMSSKSTHMPSSKATNLHGCMITTPRNQEAHYEQNTIWQVSKPYLLMRMMKNTRKRWKMKNQPTAETWTRWKLLYQEMAMV
jgi:hypothetical protein